MQITKKKILFIVAAAAALLLVFVMTKGCGKSNKVIYEFEKADKGLVKKTIAVTGVLQVIDLHIVTSKINGIVIRVYADYNSNVKKGQLLALIDSSAYEQNMIKLTSAMETAKLRMSAAESELQAKKNMLKENLISQKAMEQAELAYKTVYYEYKNIQNEYKATKEIKDSARITAPVSGTVLIRSVETNNPVAGGTPLFHIVPSLKKMSLIINVDESDVGVVKTGQDVVFTVSAFPEKSFKGKIRQVRINPVASGALVTYQSVVECDNDELMLKPGMTATATVIISQKENMLRVPNQAFLVTPEGEERGQGQKNLWIKKGSKPEKRGVKTGLTGDSHIEILEGIKEGEEILIKVKK